MPLYLFCVGVGRVVCEEFPDDVREAVLCEVKEGLEVILPGNCVPLCSLLNGWVLEGSVEEGS